VKLGSADRLAYAYGDVVPIGGLLSKHYAASSVRGSTASARP